MPHPVVAKVKTVRTDLSDWVWHFVNRGENAFDTLDEILRGRRLFGSHDRYSDTTVICFTEALLEQQGYARLSDYGVGFRKTWLFERGGLPVIYQPASLLKAFPDLPIEYRFRHVAYCPPAGLDFTWQREWRVHAAELDFTPADAVVIVPSFGEADGLLYDIEPDGDYVDGEFETFPALIPRWSFIAHDQFANIAHLDDNAIELSIRDDLPE